MFEPDHCVGTLASYLPFIGLHGGRVGSQEGALAA